MERERERERERGGGRGGAAEVKMGAPLTSSLSVELVT